MKMNRVKVRLTEGTVQLQLVVNSSENQVIPPQLSAGVWISLVIGSQNTEKP
jgi:hypothetical protein